MRNKNLGDITENIEEGIANTEFSIAGIKMTPTTIGAAIALISSILGTMYAGFEAYKAFQEMAEKLEVLDIEAVEARNVAIETKLEDAIDYTRDIKNGLKDDIIRIERINDSTSARVKDMQSDIDSRLREVSDLARETEKDVRDTMREVETRIENEMEKLETNLEDKLQKALDNPLAD